MYYLTKVKEEAKKIGNENTKYYFKRSSKTKAKRMIK